MIMHTNKDNEVNDLIIPEDDLLSFQAPSFDAVLGAYSHSFKAKPVKQNSIKLIDEIFPKENKNDKDSEDPGFSIDDDDDPLII